MRLSKRRQTQVGHDSPRVSKFCADALDHSVDLTIDVLQRDAWDSPTSSSHPCIPLATVGHQVRVAGEINHQLCRDTSEVRDVRTDRVLAAEFHPETPSAQLLSPPLFDGCHVFAEPLGFRERFGAVHDPIVCRKTADNQPGC